LLAAEKSNRTLESLYRREASDRFIDEFASIDVTSTLLIYEPFSLSIRDLIWLNVILLNERSISESEVKVALGVISRIAWSRDEPSRRLFRIISFEREVDELRTGEKR
jgi:hypothetical protein